MLQGYLANRAAPGESFLTFTRRHEVEALRAMFDAEAGE
jgi:ferredoxin-nitrite reductase